jgi:N6-L-threonylcarbamoyladenine synthase
MYKRILAIESSCDETAAAVIEDGTKIITNVVATSSTMHEKWGGIVPEVAAREQLKAIIPVIIEALNPYSTKIMDDTGGKAPDGAQQTGGQANLQKQNEAISRRINTKNQSKDNVSTDGKETRGRTHNGYAYQPIIEKNIDAIAVTVGPGLIGSLLIGTEVAKTIAYVCNKPIIPVNHVLAHMYANFVHSSQFTVHDKNEKRKTANDEQITNNNSPITFPAISLVVSGGHTELFLMTSPKDLKWLGGTIDDAAGEAFDKTARLLGFGARGGLAIQEAATMVNGKLQIVNGKTNKPNSNNSPFTIHHSPTPIPHLPRPMLHEDNLNFSFSGLKTAVLRECNKLFPDRENSVNNHEQSTVNRELINQFAYEVQEAITDVLVKKTLKAATQYDVKSILMGGGVAANLRLRNKFEEQITIYHLPFTIYYPPISLCTDNAAYIGSYAFFRGEPINWREIDAHPDLSVEV